MLECEICGKQTNKVYEVTVENTVMLACAACAEGKGVEINFGAENPRKKQASVVHATKVEIIENYGEVMRKRREEMGLPLRVLAERINVKESTLTRIEKQKALPDEKIRLKLEKELGIKLIAESSSESGKLPTKREEPVSLWDAAEKTEKK